LGGAGHAEGILRAIIPDGLLIGIDQDKDAIANATKILKPYAIHIHLFHDNFVNLAAILSNLKIVAVDGILLDLGLSLHQLEGSGRGFSFKQDEPLDMRMNVESRIKAEDLIHNLEVEDLAMLFKKYGEERWARQIARRIVKVRQRNFIRSSKQLAHIVKDAVPKGVSDHQRIHPATRVFMALRIAVNKELERLEAFMNMACDVLKSGGRLCVLSFHSLEDRIVKHRIRALERPCTCPPDFPQCVCNKKQVVRALNRKALRPTAEEIARNPMARSTRLRAAEKL
jgi:16S rRNA (cytosine1402-N4)-methyltransferase